MYDASKGIPIALNFDGARTNTLSTEVLGSTVFLTTYTHPVKDDFAPLGAYSTQLVATPLTCTVTEQRDVVFTNAVAQKTQTISRQVAQFQQPVINPYTEEKPRPGGTAQPALSI